MYYTHNLKSHLQEWCNRLYKSNFENISNNYHFFFEKLRHTKVIQAILQNAIENSTVPQSEIEEYHKFILREHDPRKYESEEHAAVVLYQVNRLFIEKNQPITTVYSRLGEGHQFNEKWYNFLDNYVQPIINYIHDNLEDVSFVLYLLEKYKKRTEWFLHKSLINKYREANKPYEQVFDDDLRLYLFDQGIDYPFSSPKS